MPQNWVVTKFFQIYSCSPEQQLVYKFGITWGWVNDFNFWVNYSFNVCNFINMFWRNQMWSLAWFLSHLLHWPGCQRALIACHESAISCFFQVWIDIWVFKTTKVQQCVSDLWNVTKWWTGPVMAVSLMHLHTQCPLLAVWEQVLLWDLGCDPLDVSVMLCLSKSESWTWGLWAPQQMLLRQG